MSAADARGAASAVGAGRSRAHELEPLSEAAQRWLRSGDRPHGATWAEGAQTAEWTREAGTGPEAPLAARPRTRSGRWAGQEQGRAGLDAARSATEDSRHSRRSPSASALPARAADLAAALRDRLPSGIADRLPALRSGVLRGGGADESERRPAERTAAVVERLAILLQGGATPASAWGHVAALAATEARAAHAAGAGSGGGRAGARRDRAAAEAPEMAVAARLRGGSGVPAALAAEGDPAWRVLGCAWGLAERSGAPLARSLGDLAASFRDVGLAEREAAVALSGPAATAKLVMALPAVGLLFGTLLGYDTIGVLLGNPFGLVCLVLGLALVGAGVAWNRRLVRAASAAEPHPGLALDLAALAMLGGMPASEVPRRVERALEDSGLDPDDPRRVDATLALASAAGVPAAALLRGEAALLRRDARTAAQRRAARLGVELMLPLGACILPAFMLLGVAPLVIAVISTTLGARAG